MKLALAAALLAASALAPTIACAQAEEMFSRDRSVAVKERPHPEYEALGIRLGAFQAFVQLQVDLGYDSNIFATETNEESDSVVRFLPRLEIESDWVRHSLTAYVRGTSTHYQEFDTENASNWLVGAAGRLDMTRRTNFGAGGEFGSEVEPRTDSNSPQSLAEPIEFDRTQAYLTGTHTFNRLRISGRGDVRELDYQDGITVSGVPVSQDDRDQTSLEFTARGDYAISPMTALFGRVAVNERDFDSAGTAQTPNRDSSGIDVVVGADFELTNLLRGEVGVGYLRQSFDSPLYGVISGLSTRLRLEYFATDLLTLSLSADRAVGDSGITGSAGYLTTNIGVTADYELRRNIIVEARAGYVKEEFDIDRVNDRWLGGLRATYLVNRRLGVTASYDFETRQSVGAEAMNDFDAHRIMLSLVAQY